MKHLITISLLLFSFCSFGQYVDPANVRKFDSTVIFVTGLARESFRLVTADTLKCKHIYVAVEQPEINGETGAVLSLGRFGKHEGRDIVCVKCHHLRKQIVNYGEGGQLRVLPSWLKGDTALIKRLLIVLD